MRHISLVLMILNSLIIFVLIGGFLGSMNGGTTKLIGYLFILGLLVVFSVLEVFLIKLYIKNTKTIKQQKSAKKEKEQKENYETEKLIPGSKARIQYLGADVCIKAKHMAGLPINEGADTFLYRCKDKVIFERNETTYELELAMISDITIKTDVEIQKSYVSSVGGAVGGYVLFGPLGAMIGGRAKEKKSQTIEKYLIFAFEKDGKVDYISFEVTNLPNAVLFVKLIENRPKVRQTVKL